MARISVEEHSLVVVGGVRHTPMTKRTMRAVERGRQFVNGVETFPYSRSKGRKLAYRWRGSRRGKRIAAWLQRTKLPAGITVEDPVVVRVDHIRYDPLKNLPSSDVVASKIVELLNQAQE